MVTVAMATMVSFGYGGLSSVIPFATVISFPFMLAAMMTGFFTLLGLLAQAASVLSEWVVFLWLAVPGILESGTIVFWQWMYWL